MCTVTIMLARPALLWAHRAVQHMLHAGHQHGLALGALVRVVTHNVAELAGNHLCTSTLSHQLEQIQPHMDMGLA